MVKKKKNKHKKKEIKCVFLVLDSSLLPVESNPRHGTYNWGGAAQAKVTALTVMCQQESCSEIPPGTLTLAQPLRLPAAPGCYSQFFLSSNVVSFFVCHKKASAVARHGAFPAEEKKTGKEKRKRRIRKNVQMSKNCEQDQSPKQSWNLFNCATLDTTRDISIV